MNKEFIKKLHFNSLKFDVLDFFRGSINGLILLSILPLILFMVMLLPEAVKQNLSFSIYEPNSWQFFSHSFVHTDWGHFLSNLRGFIIFGLILLLFANRIKEKRILFWLILTIVLSFPVISSLTEAISYPNLFPVMKTSQGASGIVSALLGILPTFWVYYLSKKEKTNFITVSYLSILLVYMACLFTFIYKGINKKLVVLTLSLALFLFVYRKNVNLILKSIVEETKGNILFFFLLLSIPLLFILFSTILFPTKVIQGSGLVDFYMHYIGVIYGILVSFIFFKIKFSYHPA